MNKKKIVEDFLDFIFDKTLKKDLQQMILHPEGLDFGIIILVCSGIELIGALDRGNLEESGNRFKATLKEYFPSRYNKYKDTLYICYRCGLAHQAFIKSRTATARNPKYKDYHLYGVNIEDKEILFIHPDVFTYDFFKAIEEYRKSLNSNSKKINSAYEAIQEICKQKLPEQIEMHCSIPNSDGKLTTTTLPLEKWIERSEVSVGNIELEDID